MPKIESFDELLDRAKVAQQAIRDLNLGLIEAHDARELQKLDGAIETLHTLSKDIDPSTPDVPVERPVPTAQAAPTVTPPAAAAQAPPPIKRQQSPPPTIASPPMQMAAAQPATTRAPPAQGQGQGQPAAQRPQPPRAAPPHADAPQRVPQVAAGRPAPAVPKPVITPSTAPTTFAEQISKGIYTRRIGRVFSTGAGMGMVPIGKLPHRDGLPPFDNCLAPDDTPVDGAYGVFVSTGAVFAAVLKRPFDGHRWQVIERIECKQQREIVDAVAHLLRRPTMNIIVD